jgi:hypothetical protein
MFVISFGLRQLRRFLYANVFLCLTIILLTGVVHNVFYQSPDMDEGSAYLLSLFALSHENTVASWYSSMLLFSTGLIALLCHWSQRAEAKPNLNSFFSYGWIFIAFLFFAMSFDEMGSLHENIGKLELPAYIVLVPGVIVALYMMGFAWFFLRKNITPVVLLALGCALFSSIPVQEYYEIKMWSATNYSDNWQRPILLILLEEGAELFASICFVAGMINFLARGRQPIEFSFSKPRTISVALLIFLFVGCIGALLNHYRSNLQSDTGIAINWLPSALIILLAFLETAKQKNSTWMHFILVSGISCFFGANLYAVLPWQEIRTTRLLISALMVGALSFILYSMIKNNRGTFLIIATISWVISLVLSLLYPNNFVPFVVYAASVFMFMAEILEKRSRIHEELNFHPLTNQYRPKQ